MATAQDAPTADTVLATVNGTDITLGHMILLRDGLPAQFRTYPDALIFDALLSQLIEQTLLAGSFEGDLPSRVQISLDNEKRDLISAEVVEDIFDSITEEQIKDAYDAKYVGVDLGFEYNASHILLDTEQEALDVMAELEAGLEFGEGAVKYSTGPSGPRGGGLNWFERGAMVGPFDAAVAEMEVEEIRGPVETQFGFHLIRLNDKRAIEAPALEDVAGELADELGAQAVSALVETLTSTADVTRSVPEGFDMNAISDLSLLGE